MYVTYIPTFAVKSTCFMDEILIFGCESHVCQDTLPLDFRNFPELHGDISDIQKEVLR